MTRLSVAVFLASTVTAALWGFAESAAEPAFHTAEITDDLENENNLAFNVDVQPPKVIGNPHAQRLIQVQLQANRAGAQPVDVVECYACADCNEVSGNSSTKLCPRSNDPTRQRKCVIYAEKYKSVSKSWLVRGCASERGSCDDIKKSHSSHSDLVELEFCSECEGYLCNKNYGHRSLADITLALLTVVVCPLFVKHTLS